MRIILPGSTQPQQYRALIRGIIKRAYIVGIFLLAIASGRNQLAIHAQEITIQQSGLPVASSNHKIPDASVIYDPVEQVTVVAIDKKRYIAPTPVPVVKTKAVAGNTTVNVPTGGNALLNALNTYRQQNGKAPLSWDGKLAAFAQQRADLFNQRNDLDNHDGFKALISSPEGFKSMGFWKLGENSAIGHNVSPQQLIEDVYGKSPGHNENELSSDFSHVGIGQNGTATNFVFGGRKM